MKKDSKGIGKDILFALGLLYLLVCNIRAGQLDADQLDERFCRTSLDTEADFDFLARHFEAWDEVRAILPLVKDSRVPLQGPLFIAFDANDPAFGHAGPLRNCSPLFGDVIAKIWLDAISFFASILRLKDGERGKLYLWVWVRMSSARGAPIPSLEEIVHRFQEKIAFAELVPAVTPDDVPFWNAHGGLPGETIDLEAVIPAFVPAYGYICYTPGRTAGILEFFTLDSWRMASVSGRVGRTTVVVLEEVPPLFDVPVAGVITAEPQVLLAHVDLLARREGIPNIFLPGAWQDPELRSLEGKPVRFTATPDGWSIEETTLSEVVESLSQRRPKALRIRDPVDSFELVSLEEAAGTFPVEKFGGKFAYLARFYPALPPETRVPGFGISFGFFRYFLEHNRIPETGVDLWSFILGVVRQERFLADASFRRQVLEDFIRVLRERTIVDRKLVSKIAEKAQEVFGGETIKLRFRSSSNAEDSLFFPGAGLYDSTSGCPADSLDGDMIGPCRCDQAEPRERSIERAVRRVWSSLWNPRAWEQRWWYGIKEEKVRMGILVTPAFLNEKANGVAMTGSPNDPSDGRYWIAVQPGEASVVRPEPGTLPELDLLTPQEDGTFQIERMRRSSLLEEGYVLSEETLFQLGRVLTSLRQAYEPDPALPRELVRLDIEFKVPAEGGLKVKQVRPFVLPGVERLLEASKKPVVSFPGKVFVTVPSGKEDIVSYHRQKAIVSLQGRELDLPSAPGGEIPWVESVTVGPERREIEVVDRGRATISYNLSKWLGGKAGLIAKLTQKSGALEIETDPLVFEVDIWGKWTQHAEFESSFLTVRDGTNLRHAVCVSSDIYPLFERVFRGDDGTVIRIYELHVPGGAKVPLKASLLFNGRSLEISDLARLSWAPQRPPLREAYLLDLNEPIEGVSAFMLVWRFGVPEPELLFLGKELEEIGKTSLEGGSSKLVRASGEAFFKRGDIDADGSVNLEDVFFLLERLFVRPEAFSCADSADVNDDGKVTVSDAVLLLQKLFGSLPLEAGCTVDRRGDLLPPCEYPVGLCFEEEE